MVLWNIRKVSERLQRTEGAVRNMVLRRQIPFRKVSGRLMFIEHEIETWINNSPGVTLDQLRKERS